ncbi:Stage III sporulation protein AB [Syntrophomonas zehnderi OL-4]|uniref:Stage III sporulation protein AB n=1 Tax=Syntrophomonas zehnderi OL-4 TaxID=690567 RepID=A0A0E4C8J6_9FIRM|nr:hypothetical protein [Syntrophomonas zehnderi]CFX49083.1 Stage III sporulation protein AB [Syntrophomonas zehnderi OL-4]
MIWIKTLGIVFIIAGFGSYGLMGARRIEKRVEQIKNIRMALGFLEKEITYLQTPLYLALKKTALLTAQPVKILFGESSRLLQDRQGITVGEAWEKALQKLKPACDLNQDDLEILKAVANQMGSSGIKEQIKLFQLIQEELQIQEENARDQMESGRKLWSYGGFILGTMVVLLLL